MDPGGHLVAPAQDVGRIVGTDLDDVEDEQRDKDHDRDIDDGDRLAPADAGSSMDGVGRLGHQEGQQPGEEDDQQDRAEAAGDRHDPIDHDQAEEQAAQPEEDADQAR